MGALIRFFTKFSTSASLCRCFRSSSSPQFRWLYWAIGVRGAMRWRFRYLAIRASASGWLSHWC